MNAIHPAPMNLLREKRSVTYAIVFGIWAQTFIYCVLHDQYLIRISPEHFTVYHPPLWGITDLTLLAVAWAFRASIGPGLGLGLIALFLARPGNRPKIEPRRLLKMVPWLLLATEVAGLAAGAWVWKTKQPLFPEIVYPDLTEPMLISQSIQLTCYGMAALVSTGFLAWIVRERRRA